MGALQWRSKLRRWAWATFGLAALLSIAGGSPLPKILLQTLERPYVARNSNELPAADAVLVLGGFLKRTEHEPAGMDLGDAGDRLMTGVELIRQQKAAHLIIGGGSCRIAGNVVTEADLVERWTTQWNLLPSPLLRLPVCTNTRDEAVALKQMMLERGWTNVLLVTSAWHLRRSEALFRSADVPVTPVGCDYHAYPSGEDRWLNAWPIVPQPRKLEDFRLYCHEIIGWWSYRARGWIKSDDDCSCCEK